MAKIWESDDYIDENTLSVNVNRLRKKLSGIGLDDFIITKRDLVINWDSVMPRKSECQIYRRMEKRMKIFISYIKQIYCGLFFHSTYFVSDSVYALGRD